MEKAFDTILQSDVFATMAARTGGFEPYRYECLCCGEEVYIAAAYSREMTPHFRHRRGNNDKECEQYLGQPGAIARYIQIRRKKQDQVDFYFNRDQMTFEVGILLAVDEIIECESRNEKILLKDKYYSVPFYSVSVNRRNFVGGERFFAPLKVFSPNYAVALSEKNYIRMYEEVFASGNRLNFYKVSGQSDRYRARRIGTKIVYTETRYFVVSEDERCINALCNLINCVDIEEKFDFQTMNRRFYALTMRFTTKDYNVSRVLLDSEYQLEYAEKAIVLWPPMITCDDQILCETDKLYVHTSFELLSHGNINCDACLIDDMGNGLYQLQVDDDIKIFRKNAELIINRTTPMHQDDESIDVYEIHTDKYEVPEEGDFFLFNADGCMKLLPHQHIYLSGKDYITHYQNHCICGRICANKAEALSTEAKIREIKMYWKLTEPYTEATFEEGDYSKEVLNYLEECRNQGTINSMIKRYIEEGRL